MRVRDVIYQSNTRHSNSSGHPNTDKRVENMTSSEIRGVWIANETLSRVFDISSQPKQKLRNKHRRQIVKIYLKTGNRKVISDVTYCY